MQLNVSTMALKNVNIAINKSIREMSDNLKEAKIQ